MFFAVNLDWRAGGDDFVKRGSGLRGKADAPVGGGTVRHMTLMKAERGGLSVQSVESHEVSHGRPSKFHPFGHRAGAGVEFAGLFLSCLRIHQFSVEVRSVAGIFLTNSVVAGGCAESGFAAGNAGCGDEFGSRINIGTLAIEIDDDGGAGGIERGGGKFRVEHSETSR